MASNKAIRKIAREMEFLSRFLPNSRNELRHINSNYEYYVATANHDQSMILSEYSTLLYTKHGKNSRKRGSLGTFRIRAEINDDKEYRAILLSQTP